MSAVSLPIDTITVDTRAQSRAEIDMGLVAEYAELMRDGVIFPPLTVLNDGSTHWLSEGFHRIAAYREAGILIIPCIVKPGGLREAILLSVGSNANHGKRRSNADKRRAVELLLKDECWASWSDSAIAKQCAVDHKTVASVRESYLGKSQDAPSKPQDTARTATRNGTTYTVKTGNIGGKVKVVDEIVRDSKMDFPIRNAESASPDLGKSKMDLLQETTPCDFDAALDALLKKLPRGTGKIKDEIIKTVRAMKRGFAAPVRKAPQSDNGDDVEKLRCQLAYIKDMVRQVYYGTAAIRLYGDDEIAFDALTDRP